uniref:Uncharacterized protein n=1 Tax=Glossina palpalis gambiensis TaxID=67801 RepID=A0A1B0BBY4_9MUSC
MSSYSISKPVAPSVFNIVKSCFKNVICFENDKSVMSSRSGKENEITITLAGAPFKSKCTNRSLGAFPVSGPIPAITGTPMRCSSCSGVSGKTDRPTYTFPYHFVTRFDNNGLKNSNERNELLVLGMNGSAFEKGLLHALNQSFLNKPLFMKKDLRIKALKWLRECCQKRIINKIQAIFTTGHILIEHVMSLLLDNINICLYLRNSINKCHIQSMQVNGMEQPHNILYLLLWLQMLDMEIKCQQQKIFARLLFRSAYIMHIYNVF